MWGGLSRPPAGWKACLTGERVLESPSLDGREKGEDDK
jgi:hypothetical protein